MAKPTQDELLAAAAEMCRRLSMADRTELDSATRRTGYQTRTERAVTLTFTLRINGREVDSEGNVLARRGSGVSRDEPARFYSDSGLVDCWNLIATIKERAATLGVEVTPEIRYVAEAVMRHPERVLGGVVDAKLSEKAG